MEFPPLLERASAFRQFVKDNPELTKDERLALFTCVVWPKEARDDFQRRRTEQVDYAHLMQCCDPGCPQCAGTGIAAA